MGLIIFGFGVIGGIVFSIVLTWYPDKMMKAAYLTCITSILTLIFFFYADIRASKAEISVSLAIHGFFLLPILFIAYELAVKQTQPSGVGDSTSCGLINVVANFLGFLLAISLTPALDKQTKASTNVTITVLFVNLALALMFLFVGSIFTDSSEREPQIQGFEAPSRQTSK